MTRTVEVYDPPVVPETWVEVDPKAKTSSEEIIGALSRLGVGPMTVSALGPGNRVTVTVDGGGFDESEVEVALDTAKIAFTSVKVSTTEVPPPPPEAPTVDFDAAEIVPRTIVEYAVEIPTLTWLRYDRKVVRDVVRVTVDDLDNYGSNTDCLVGDVEEAIEKSGLGKNGKLTEVGSRLFDRLIARMEEEKKA